MKKLLLSATVIAAAVMAITAKTSASDPVVMTVDNRDVRLSEFEYLYNKNNNQQLAPLTFDEYVDMFVNYKLKVADALNAKLDTTESFRVEYDKFRRDLAQPFLKDSVAYEQLVQELYNHTKEDVYVSHIMLPAQDPAAPHQIDSIRALIMAGTITFEDAAAANSVDRASAARGGRMGWVTGMGPYPWAFEKASYDTPVGVISEPINSGVGYHLVRPEERRTARGEVLAQHILVLTRGMDDDAKAAQKAKIDSIYEVVIAGADFSDVARRESQDPGSAKNGGMLDWFGSGRMVAEFDSIAFAMADGEISKPFATAYGYHIIHKLDHRGNKSLEEMRPEIEKAIDDDNARAQLPINATLDKAAAATNSKKADNLSATLKALAEPNNGATDSLMLKRFRNSELPAFTVNGKTTTIGEIMQKAPLRELVPTYVLLDAAERWIDNAYNTELTTYVIDNLPAKESAYNNLINEYRDGILLFDISNRNVWERATKDTKGLNDYFQANREKYSTWTAPHYKAYVIFAQNDSTLQEVMTFANANYGNLNITEIDQEAFTNAIKDKFGRYVKVERVIASEGDNPITDFLGFGAEKPENKSQAWKAYTDFAAKVIDQPEEPADVKGAVVTDYQAELEKQWIKELHNKYKVKINKKELSKAQK